MTDDTSGRAESDATGGTGSDATGGTESEDAPEGWAAAVRENRAEKDRFFAEHPQSPIPPAAREDFDGLRYFEPDPDFRVEATLAVHDDPDPVPLEMTAGQPERYLHVATLTFDLAGETRSLRGLKQPGDEALFVPFTDGTTGESTYAEGRYMEFTPEGDLVDGATLVLDFNLAYNPFCAYSATFACPLPPEANHLAVAVTAGERTPPEAVVSASGDPRA